MDVGDDLFLTPGSQLTRRAENQVQPSPSSRVLQLRDGLGQRNHGGVDLSLADVGESKVS